MKPIRSLGFVLILAATGCTQPQNLGSEALGTVGNPPKNDGSCDQGLVVCNGICTDVENDAKNCGACAQVCGNNGACHQGVCDGACGAEGKACCVTDMGYSCNNGLTCDNGTCQQPKQCGQCNLANATSACVNGVCMISSCDQGFADCNGIYADGCEVSLYTDANNCGACGQACGNGGQCAKGQCMNANMCGNCNLQNAQSGCVNNVCVIQSCNQGFADCDQNYVNGCEVSLYTDANNCGACGKACAQGQQCVNGQCMAQNGCGQCNLPNATSKCVNNVCMIAQCNAGYADCNQLYADGCEVNINSDKNNCGACGQVCGANKTCTNALCN
jgi:hypothetical protein